MSEIQPTGGTGPLKRRPPLAPFKVVYLLRHGQALHNLKGGLKLRDPPLTPQGCQQASAVRASSPVLQEVQLVVASPMRRALETAHFAFAGQRERPTFVAHPDAQEVGSHPSDTGSEADVLAPDFGGEFDLSLCLPRWYEKASPFDLRTRERSAAGCDELRVRLERLSAWLLARPEASIALVAHHGVFAHIESVEMELGYCEVLECTLDAAGWSVQRAASDVVQVLDGRARGITNYNGRFLCGTLGAIRALHGREAASLSEEHHHESCGREIGDGEAVQVVRARGASRARSGGAGAAAAPSPSLWSKARGVFHSPAAAEATSSVPDGMARKVAAGVGFFAFVAVLARGSKGESARSLSRGMSLPRHMTGRHIAA